jgi:hypothetical protein
MEEEIKMKCPMCQQPVTKVIDTDKDSYSKEPTCISEYYLHIGERLIKFKHPKHNYYGEGK